MKLFKILTSAEDVVRGLRERGTCIGRVLGTEEYHRWKGEVAAALGLPVISKSGLHEFAESAYRFHYNREHGVRRGETPGLRLGSMVDCLVLTPGEWGRAYCEEEVNLRTKEGRARRDELAAAGVELVKPEEAERARAIAGCARGALDRLGLRAGETYTAQVAMFAVLDELDGQKLAMPVVVTGCIDILPYEGEVIYDLKTTSADVEQEGKLCRACEDFAYGVQAALYVDLYNLCMGECRGAFRFFFVGTGQEAVQCRVASMSPEVLEMYRGVYKRLLRRYALAEGSGDWGEALLPEVVFAPSKWELEKIYNE